MKHFLFLIQFAMLISIVINSCTSPNTNDKEKDVHKVRYEIIYDYYDNSHHNSALYDYDNNDPYDETLVVGLSSIVKETSFYNDGTNDYCLRFCVLGVDLEKADNFNQLRIKDIELFHIEDFLDSCICGSLSPKNEEWKVKINDDAYFFHRPYEKSVCAYFLPEEVGVDLQITPEKLKEVIEKAKKE